MSPDATARPEGSQSSDPPPPRRGGAAVSIADVAKRANVSISTVSRVVNQREVVNENTRQRVVSAIRELGYQPNAFARGLMLRRSEIVGLALPDLHGEFYSEIIRGANERARSMGYFLVVSSARDGDDSQTLLNALQQRALLDGVAIMVSEMNDHLLEVLSDFRLPFVMLDEDVSGALHDCVVIDQRQGAVALMQHLVDRCGAKRIIFVGGLQTNIDTRARFDAYRAVIAEAGLPFDERDVYYLDYQYDTAYRLGADRVRSWAGAGSCVFAANDEMAAGIVAAANQAGVQVPAELAVVGFDDTRIASMTRPALTTVRVPMSRMGAEAIELLCRRIAEPQRPPSRLTLLPELIVRESCGGAGSRA